MNGLPFGFPTPSSDALILGVDPGFNGALAFIQAAQPQPIIESLVDMPISDHTTHTLLSASNRSEINAERLVALVGKYAHRTSLAVLERVGAAPGQGVSSMFRFGEGYGLVRGVLASFKLRVVTPPPAVWKAKMNLSSSKNESLEMARKEFGPEAAEKYFKLKKHDGRAEAALLALYGMRAFRGDKNA